MAQEKSSIVIDAGSGFIKAGWSSGKEPEIILPSVVGYPKHQKMLQDSSDPEYYVASQLKTGLMKMVNVIERGQVMDWDYMDSLLTHIYSGMRVSSLAETTLTLLMQPGISYKERELYAELIFETHGLGKLLFSSTSFASYCSLGLPLALVVDSGESLTSAIAYLRGSPVEDSLQTLEIGGRDVTQELCKLLGFSGYRFETSSQMELIKVLKETECKVQVTRDKQTHTSRGSSVGVSQVLKEKDKYSQKKIYLPDGNAIIYDEDWNKCFDIYFNSIHTKKMSLQELIHYSLLSLDPPIRKSLLSSIVITGGATQAPFFSKRLHEEYDLMYSRPLSLAKTVPQDRPKMVLLESPKRILDAWNGGCLIPRTAIGSKFIISKQEYEEKGGNMVIEKYLL